MGGGGFIYCERGGGDWIGCNERRSFNFDVDWVGVLLCGFDLNGD